MGNPDPRRRRLLSDTAGRLAEAAAEGHLAARGWEMVARRWRGPAGTGEIDLVARRDGVLAFVEVKARPSAEAAFAALGASGRRRLAAAAEAFLASRPDLARLDCRFDLVAILPGTAPLHLEGAFMLGE